MHHLCVFIIAVPGAIRGSNSHFIGQLRLGIRKNLCVHIESQIHRTIMVVLGHINPIQLCHISPNQENGTPNAGVRKPGTPIPSKHTMGLSDVRESHHGIR